ncbi:Kelch repeat-containing protein [Pedobacter nototheniae]|uniref:hypothetical protein n=1 Tax=Pedobacter nototheniae TaxID=2488994 RepID=UPI00103EFF32|nr:hypothetical protein [Pedobacter nototheniae]
MKNIKTKTALFLLLMVGIFGACKKNPLSYSKDIVAFKFIVKDDLGVDKEYNGVISNNEIVVSLPINIDVTDLKASFTINNERTIVMVGNQVQESGISEQNFTNPIKYNVKAEDKSIKSYTVSVDKKVSLKAFGFYKEDNPTLTTDYIGIIKGLAVQVSLPETVNLTTLVARFETSTGAILKVNTTTQESKKTPNDFTNTVVYTFTESSLPAPLNYTVSISILGRQWSLMSANLTGLTTAVGIKIAVNPITNYPYFIYQRSGKDEDGVAIPTDNKKIAVIGYSGSSWANVGPATGVSDFRADVPGIAFSTEGVPYIAYKDYLNGDQKATVQKFNGSAWTVVGTSRFTPIKVDYLSLALSSTDVPTIAMAKNGTDASGVPARGLYVTNYGSSWNAITPPGGITVFYDQIIRGLDGKIYVGIMDRSTGVNKPSLYKYDNNVWSAVGQTSFTAPDGMVGFQTVSIAIDKNGEAYLAFQVAPSSGRLNHVMKFNKSAGTWQELGSPVSSGGEKDKFVLLVDGDGVLYFAYANASSVSVKTFNKETNNWNTERKVIKEKVNEFDMQVAPDGTIYLVASIAADNKTVAYKYAK